MSEILKLANIRKTYLKGQPGEILVLDGIELTLEAGEVVGLIAPSGAGKSTLLHIAGLLDTADQGSVEIAGQKVEITSDRRVTKIRRQEVGFIYQFHHLLPEFSALENIVLPQLADGQGEKAARDRAIALLTSVGLAERASHRPAELSGGEQQRVAFCRALANKPRLLLADEPTGNLDPATSDVVFAALMDLVREERLAALIATHNYDLAARMDRTIRLEGGQFQAG